MSRLVLARTLRTPSPRNTTRPIEHSRHFDYCVFSSITTTNGIGDGHGTIDAADRRGRRSAM